KRHGDLPRLTAAGILDDAAEIVAVFGGDFSAMAADFFDDGIVHNCSPLSAGLSCSVVQISGHFQPWCAQTPLPSHKEVADVGAFWQRIPRRVAMTNAATNQAEDDE